MARRTQNEILYRGFKDFLNLCLLQDLALLWPDRRAWTLENVSAVKRRMVDSPLFGSELSFEEKLTRQLQGASPEEWMIICDIYYVYFLPSTFITLDKKQNDIRWAALQGSLVPPPSNDAIWEAQTAGFTRTAQKYHYKYAQFWLILLFAHHVKEQEDRQSIVTKPRIMQQTLDVILENISTKTDRAYDIRHAMLYMAFPDFYERIISTRDKERIIKKYRNLIQEPIPADLDERILKIREVLSKRHDKPNRAFDFYEDLKAEWRVEVGTPKGAVTVSTDMGQVTVPGKDELEEKSAEVTQHTEIQWLLLRLGGEMGLDLWVARNDRNKEVDGQLFAELPRLKRELPLKFDEVTNRTVELIDVLWLKGNAILAAFEIESTTSIYSGILRLADLIAMQPNLNIPLYIVAPDERRNKVIAEINRPVFSHLSPSMSEICRYISFSALRDRISQVTDVVKYLKPEFLEELSESCEIEEADH